MRKVSLFLFLLTSLFSVIFLFSDANAQGNVSSYTCAVYFTGVGCPHCAKTDPIILDKLLKENPDLIIIEYEIYQQKENSSLILNYNKEYNSGLGVPLIIFQKDNYLIGDRQILAEIDKWIQKYKGNSCPLPDGSLVDFQELDINSLPGKPKIWTKDKILMKIKPGKASNSLKDFVTTENISSVAQKINFKKVDPQLVPLSGSFVEFENAIQADNWGFQWNGEPIIASSQTSSSQTSSSQTSSSQTSSSQTSSPQSASTESIQKSKFTIPKLVSLAIVDAVNPCALAVLALMLIAILTYNPHEKRNILLAGFAFIISVFCMYLVYGLVIVNFFKFVQALTTVRLWLYKALGVCAIGLGALNIKDFIKYKPGGFLTEMPLSLRPTVKKITEGVTSPQGAFLVGLFVTLFLLPCTIGPYVIAGGILSSLEFMRTIGLLLLYNFIFVIPMIAIVLIIWLGLRKIQDVQQWKDKNIKYLHLIAGLIMCSLGIAMTFGLI
ncbi:GAP family protein [bacterium]|nr:GAP family protein [bacterium]